LVSETQPHPEDIPGPLITANNATGSTECALARSQAPWFGNAIIELGDILACLGGYAGIDNCGCVPVDRPIDRP